MAFGAATVAARDAGAVMLVDPRPFAVGSIAETFAQHRHLGAVLPAVGYSTAQLADLAATIDRTPCDIVVTGTPIDLSHVISIHHPIRHARYDLREIGKPTIRDVIAPIVRQVIKD
jgi:predicted GTPase